MWYSEQLNISQRQQTEMRNRAIAKVIPNIEKYLAALGVEDIATAPLISPDSLLAYYKMPTYEGTSLSMPLFSLSKANSKL